MRYDFLIEQMTWSASRLSSFEQCPYQWLMHYIFHEQEVPRFFSQFGRYMHELLRQYLSGEISKDSLPSRYLCSFREYVTAPAPSGKIFSDYMSQGMNYLRSIPISTEGILWVERKAEFPFAGKPFTAVLDLLRADKERGLVITDHKSRALKPYSGKKKPTASDKELDRFLRQLYIYAAAVKSELGRYPDWLEFNCFRTGMVIGVPFKRDRLEQTEEWASSTIQSISKEDSWAGHPDFWFCRHICGLSDQCEYAEYI